MDTLRAGSAAHRDALHRFFVDSYQDLDTGPGAFPELAPAELQKLRALPIWEEAVRTEASTARLVQAFGRKVRDPWLQEAVAMNGLEEGRHALLLKSLTSRYGIPVPEVEGEEEKDAEWGFLRVGYGECFDSFFGFGLFALARDAGAFPRPLVEAFEPVMQEEARHIIFHANWVAYARSEAPLLEKGVFAFRQALAVAVQTASRVKTALRVGSAAEQDNFTMNAHEALGDITPRAFLELCLKENERRLAPYDPRLLRPTLMPRMARAALAVL